MGWTRRANPNWANWWTRKEADYKINIDRQGNTRRNGWCTTWTTGSTSWFKRHTAKQHRRAHKLQIAHELYQDDEWQQELHEQAYGWDDSDYDDSYFDDWGDACYEYPEPEPEPDYEYDYGWYDPYDDY